MIIRNLKRSHRSGTEPQTLKSLYKHTNFEKYGKKDLNFNDRDFDILRVFFNFMLPPISGTRDKKTIIIAGTKGKGSTACFLAKLLFNSDTKIGLYTSPHIFKINERIKINDNPISNEEFDNYYNYIINKHKYFKNDFRGFSPSTFEILTIMAKLHFDQNSTDIDIFEVGLGGRYDAVNCLTDKRISVITSISLDHTNILGNTIDMIFFEKLGIARTNRPLFIGFQKYIDINDTQPALSQFTLFHYNRDFKIIGNKIFINGKKDICLNIIPWDHFPAYQGYNLALSSAVANYVNDTIFEQNKALFAKDFACECRYELFSYKGHKILLDGAHNADSLEGLLSEVWKKWRTFSKVLVFGCMKDKDIKGMLNVIHKYSPDRTIFQKVNSPRALDFSKGILDFRPLLKKFISNNINETLNIVSDNNTAQNNIIIITGSLYLCSEYRAFINNM